MPASAVLWRTQALLTMQSCALRLRGRSEPQGAPGPRLLLRQACLQDRRRSSAAGALLELLGRMRRDFRTCQEALAVPGALQRVCLVWKHGAEQILHANSCMMQTSMQMLVTLISMSCMSFAAAQVRWRPAGVQGQLPSSQKGCFASACLRTADLCFGDRFTGGRTCFVCRTSVPNNTRLSSQLSKQVLSHLGKLHSHSVADGLSARIIGRQADRQQACGVHPSRLQQLCCGGRVCVAGGKPAQRSQTVSNPPGELQDMAPRCTLKHVK